MQLTREKAENRRGQAIIMAVFSLTFLFAAMGLAIDLGYAYYLKSRVQTAADAAASAAAVYAKNHAETCGGAISCGASYTCAGVSPPTTSLEAGCLYISGDGPPTFTAQLVENSTTPPGVSGNSPALWIQATVNTSSPNAFLFGAGFHSSSISASAIAAISALPSAACVYVLSSGASPAVTVSGSSSLTTTGCGVFVNSSANPAVSVTGASSITASTQVIVNGVTQITGSSSVTPTPVRGNVTDPLAWLPAPSFSGCDHTNYSLSNNNTATIGPGVYCGGITVNAATLTLNSGIYILNGGGLTVGNAATVNAASVMFYNTAGAGEIAAPIVVTGSGKLNLSAPTSGTYQGIAFFQDRSITYASSNSISNAGGGNITGTYYFPTTDFQFQGSSNVAVYAAFVVNTLTISGASSLKSDPTGSYTGLGKTVALIQ